MAADTPVVLGPRGLGGSRPGSGAKKNQHRISCGELRKSLESKLGMPYHEMLAEVQLRLYNDFKEDRNVKEFIRFTESMCNRVLEAQVQQVELSNTDSMSDDELRARAKELISLNAQKAVDGQSNAH